MTKETLPRSIVEAAPTAARIAETLHQLDGMLASLERDLEKAARSGVVPLARAFVALHRLKDKVEGFSKGFGALFEQTQTHTVPDAFETEGVPHVPLTEGFRVTTSATLYASIKGDRKQEAWNWLRKHRLGDLITETVNASTLSAAARRMREEDNIDLPDDLFTVADLHRTSVTQTKK